MFAIEWDYLLGKSFASAWNSGRKEPEWPPHPDRVFQALVAAWAADGQDAQAGEALRWLEELPPPVVIAATSTQADNPEVYVPLNTIPSPKKDKLISFPHNRRARHFPSVVVRGISALYWPEAQPDISTLNTLKELCLNVTHLGMERSVVRMFATDSPDQLPKAYKSFVPDDQGDLHLRISYPGRLEELLADFTDGQRPRCARWCAYKSQAQQTTDSQSPHSIFSSQDWMVYTCIAADHPLGLAQAPRVIDALRHTLIKAADGMPTALRLISGHEHDGSPLTVPHVLMLPLGFLGHEHADGHLLGLAIVFPECLTFEERQDIQRAIVNAEDMETGEIILRMGQIGTMTLIPEQRPCPPKALQPQTWCGRSRFWTTAVPMVCDQMLSRKKRYNSWLTKQVVTACERIGLPEPERIECSSTPFISGAPTCKEVPVLPRRSDGQTRWHLHLRLTFHEPVAGPVVLGAGRYRGYGLCRPF